MNTVLKVGNFCGIDMYGTLIYVAFTNIKNKETSILLFMVILNKSALHVPVGGFSHCKHSFAFRFTYGSSTSYNSRCFRADKLYL